MTAWEVATYLLSRQRVEAIWRNAAYGFPQPISEFPRRWDRAQVEYWADAHWWGRATGGFVAESSDEVHLVAAIDFGGGPI